MHILDHTDMRIQLFLIVIIFTPRRLMRRRVLGDGLKGLEHGLADLFVCLIDGFSHVQLRSQDRGLKLRLYVFDKSLYSQNHDKDGVYREDFEHE
jgi:hypothetical protein